ncbi:PREDICTED: ribonuclease H1-like [Vollenhovia emeryi]|uniref:ribonuclease H1-like n=1 Tax=Vollenhovia emeryi TaxID=411798 RepID=UPI0005F41A36|nr:PREDICTED: ribonuclease H1-like [Vollenhovia emeryi]
MPYYAVANGRTTGVFDNWEDCKDQVHGYSYNNYKKFDTPDQAWDFVDQHSSKGKLEQSFSDDSKQVACRNNNQVALQGEASGYRRTDCTQGKNGVIIRERSYTSGRAGSGYFVEKYTRTYWKNN